MLRYAIVGCGAMGQEHILNILSLPQGARITVLCDGHAPSTQAAQQLCAARQQRPQSFTSLAQWLGQEPDIAQQVDVVVVATPNFTHAQLLRDLLPQNVHILIEKPLCTTLADCLDIVQLSKGREKLVWVAQEYRYMPPVAEMIQIAHNGGVGRIEQVAIREHREPFYPKVNDWNRFSANTGGTLVEKCCHYFNLMELILGESANKVFASGDQRVNHLDERYGGKTPDMLDSAYVVLEYPSGARAMLDLCMFAENSVDNEQIVVVGHEGKLESLLPSLTLRYGKRVDWGRREIWGQPSGTGIGVMTKRVWDTRIRYAGHHFGASYMEHLYLQEAILKGLPAQVSVSQATRCVAVGLAAHRSIDEGRAVTVQELYAELGAVEPPLETSVASHLKPATMAGFID